MLRALDYVTGFQAQVAAAPTPLVALDGDRDRRVHPRNPVDRHPLVRLSAGERLRSPEPLAEGRAMQMPCPGDAAPDELLDALAYGALQLRRLTADGDRGGRAEA